MRQALYRKYRPKTLSELVGQEYVKITIGNQLAAGQVGHAYLFAGPKGTGKTTVARILARSVNCLELTNGVPCGKCVNCVAFDNNQMMDLIEIDAASNNSVDSVRDLISKISLAPTLGKYKIYILDEAHQLSKPASNALLKTLEEPPSHAIFVLATTEPDRLLPTIISRCQRFDFRFVPVGEAVKRLAEIAKAEKMNISKDGLEFIARQSGGSERDAESLLEQASFIEGEITQAKLTEWLGFVDWQTVYEMTEWLVDGKVKEILAKIDELYHNGYDLNRLTASWMAIVRQVLAAKLGNGDRLPVTKEQINHLVGLAQKLSVQRTVIILQELMWAGREMRSVVVPQTPLEIAVVKLAAKIEPAEDEADEELSKPAGMSGGTKTKENQSAVASEGATTDKTTQRTGIVLSEIQEIWPRVLEQMRLISPTLAGMLVKAQIGVERDRVVVKFTSKFHKEKMEQPSGLGLLQRAFREVGYDCAIVCALEQVINEQPADIQNVSEIFGGVL